MSYLPSPLEPGIRTNFFKLIAHELPRKLFPYARHGEMRFSSKSIDLKVRYPEFYKSYYAIRLLKTLVEIGFFLDGHWQQNILRLELIEPHGKNFSDVLGCKIIAESWGKKRGKLVLSLSPDSLRNFQKQYFESPNKNDIEEVVLYTNLLSKFINSTYKILWDIYNQTATETERSNKPPLSRKKSKKQDKETHNRLDQTINDIRHFIQGKTAKPSDILLCDWVYLCYAMNLYEEGVAVYNLISPGTVEENIYARAAKYAKICRLNSKPG